MEKLRQNNYKWPGSVLFAGGLMLAQTAHPAAPKAETTSVGPVYQRPAADFEQISDVVPSDKSQDPAPLHGFAAARYRETHPKHSIRKVRITTVAAPAPAETTKAVTAPVPSGSPLSREAWLHLLGWCESGDNPAENTGNGYYGEFQFSESAWMSLVAAKLIPDYARPDLAPQSVQEQAIIINTDRSTGGLQYQNPGCYARYSSEGLTAFPPKG